MGAPAWTMIDSGMYRRPDGSTIARTGDGALWERTGGKSKRTHGWYTSAHAAKSGKGGVKWRKVGDEYHHWDGWRVARTGPRMWYLWNPEGVLTLTRYTSADAAKRAIGKARTSMR